MADRYFITTSGLSLITASGHQSQFNVSSSVRLTFAPSGTSINSSTQFYGASYNSITFAPSTTVAGGARVASASGLSFAARSAEAASFPIASGVGLTFQAMTDPRLQIDGDVGTLRIAIRSDVNGRYPFCWADTNEGRVLFTNGIGPMLRWDGSRYQAEEAGVPAPTLAVPFSGSGGGVGIGEIDGVYAVFQRYVDRYGQVSDPSPIGDFIDLPPVEDLVGQQGNITAFFGDPAIDDRILVETVEPHGLVDGDSVTIDPGKTRYNADGSSQTFLWAAVKGTWTIMVSDAPSNVFGSEVSNSGRVYALVDSKLPQDQTEQHFRTVEEINQGASPAPYYVTVFSAPTGISPSYDAFWYLSANATPTAQISSGPHALSLAGSVVYSSVEVPRDPRIVRRQLCRTTAGQQTTFYVDIDTADLNSTTFTSTLNDEDLSAQEAVPILDDLGNISAATHGVPPSHKGVIAAHLGRMFATVNVPYIDGHVAVTTDSYFVNGIGTNWPSTFANRFLYVAGVPKAYEIESVDAAGLGGLLRLVNTWQEPTDLFARYAIAPAPAERKVVYYSEAGLSESWPATNAIAVQEDGDDITGLMPSGSYLYILERRHIYRFTFRDDPAVDGAIFMVAQRGCLNNRLWVQVEDSAYMLDESGIHVFNGGTSQSISQPIQDLFQRDGVLGYKINWDADTSLWHAQESRQHFTIRWFVAMSQSRLPRHAICTNYRTGAWWLEEYKRPVCSSITPFQRTDLVFTGADHREVLTLDATLREGIEPSSPYTWTGDVTAWGPFTITDAAASFDTTLAVNLAVILTEGRGKGQWRRVVSATRTTLRVDRPWLENPDLTTKYAVGGIDWKWQSGEFRLLSADVSNARDVEVVFQPLHDGAPLDIALTYGHSSDARLWTLTREGEGVSVAAGVSAVTVDMASGRDQAKVGMEGHAERSIGSDSYVNVTLSGVQIAEAVRIYRVTMSGVETEG